VRAPRFVLLAVALGVACGGGGGGSSTSPTEVAAGVTGTWRATRAEYVNVADPTQRVDAISHGTTMTLAFGADGTFTLTTVDPGQKADVVTGTWTSSHDVLTMVPAGEAEDSQFDVALDGNNLSLYGGHVEYDFGNDGHVEEAILNMDLTHG
jgi:phosphoheptose isomerase